MEDFNDLLKELKAKAVKIPDKEELFDMGVAGGQLKIIYAIRDLGVNPSNEAIEDMIEKQSIEITTLALSYMMGGGK